MADPIALLFGGMEKLGPGSNQDSAFVLNQLPKSNFEMIVDAGCGSGRQTLFLLQDTTATIHAVDSFQPFLDSLTERAQQLGLDSRLTTHHPVLRSAASRIRRELRRVPSQG